MSAPAVLWGHAWADLDDATLLAQVRTGDADAYAELWRRHLPAAYAVAHRHRGRTSAEDVVAEASLRVYDLIRAGKGPLTNFRSYFLSAVRTIAVDHARGELRAVPTEDTGLEAAAPATPAYDPSPGVDHALVRVAFARLAERDQQVLWRTAIEGTTPAAVADDLGLTANGVSVIALRARDSLRAKYLDAHADRAIDRAQDEECRWALSQMGRFVRCKLPVRQRARVEEHLRSCRHAQGLAYEMAEVNRALPAVMVPLIFMAGSTAAAAWAAAGGVAGGLGLAAGGSGDAGQVAAKVTDIGTKVAALGVAAVLGTGYAAGSGIGPVAPAVAAAVPPAAVAPPVPGPAASAPPAAAAPAPPAARPSQTAVPAPPAAPARPAVPPARPAPTTSVQITTSSTTSSSSTSSTTTSSTTTSSTTSSTTTSSTTTSSPPAPPLLGPVAAVYDAAFDLHVVVPSEGLSTLVLKFVPTGQVDLTAVPLFAPEVVPTWTCGTAGPRIECEGSGPVTFSVLAALSGPGSGGGGGAATTPGTVAVELVAPDGTTTTAEVLVAPATDPSVTTTTTTTQTTTTTTDPGTTTATVTTTTDPTTITTVFAPAIVVVTAAPVVVVTTTTTTG